MALTPFLSATLALLIAPGPTNTLMALSGAQSGPRPMVRLIPAELLGYLTMILPLVALGASAIDTWPAVTTALKLIAAIWIAILAVRLWRTSDTMRGEDHISARRVYVTTVLNPKALIFGVILLPPLGDPALPLRLTVFTTMVVTVAIGWTLAGTLTRTGQKSHARTQIFQRIASAWLTIVSATLMMGVLRA